MAKILRALFFWLASWFRPRSSQRIFSYFDGQKYRTIDPVYVLNALAVHPKYAPERHYEAAVKECKIEAMEIVAGAVCDVFHVQPYVDGKGLTIAERLSLLATFYLYCETVKKNIRPSATLQ